MGGNKQDDPRRGKVATPREDRSSSPNGRTAQRRNGRKRQDRSEIQPCTKYTLFFWNFMVFVAGLLMTALGSYILYLKGKQVHDVLEFFLDPACDITLAGAITTTMGFFGCWGSLRENTVFLNIYYYAMCCFLLLELGLAILLFVAYYVPQAKDTLFPSNLFQTAILEYRSDPDMQHLIDSMHKELECCGLKDSDDGFLDWNGNVYFNCSATNISPEACSVPYSCCKTKYGDKINYQCGYGMIQRSKAGEIEGNDANTHKIYTRGCLKALGVWIDTHALVLGGVMLGILAPQMFAIVFTRNLMEMIYKQKSHW